MYSLSAQSASGLVIPIILKHPTEAGPKTTEVTSLSGGFYLNHVKDSRVNFLGYLHNPPG